MELSPFERAEFAFGNRQRDKVKTLFWEGVQVAPAPANLLPKNNASATLLAYVVIAKYPHALPLSRQSHILTHHGVELPRIPGSLHVSDR
jgi:hypothetical protein